MQPGSGNQLCDALAENELVVVDYTAMLGEVSERMERGARAKVALEMYKASVRDINIALQCEACDNIVDDGLTGMQEMVLGAVLALNARQKAQFEDWGQAIDKIMEIYTVMTAGRPNFVLTAHIQIEKDELTGKIKETPLVFGKQLPNKLLALFDNVFVTGFSGGTYFWYTKPQPLMPTIGSRVFHDLPEHIHQNYEELFAGAARDAKARKTT